MGRWERQAVKNGCAKWRRTEGSFVEVNSLIVEWDTCTAIQQQYFVDGTVYGTYCTADIPFFFLLLFQLLLSWNLAADSRQFPQFVVLRKKVDDDQRKKVDHSWCFFISPRPSRGLGPPF